MRVFTKLHWLMNQWPWHGSHRRWKRGVCRGSDTPTIYVGDIGYWYVYPPL